MKILMGDSLAYESPIQVGSHNYARLFLDSGHEVFWLGGSLHLLNALRASRGNPHDQSLTESWRMGGKRVHERMVTYHPMTLVPYRNAPVLDSLWMLRHTLDTCLPPLESVLKRYHFEQADVLWLGQSFYSLSLLSHARYRKLVYRMADSYAEFKGVPPSMNAAEEEIIARADTIFCTAHKLYEDVRAKAGDKVHYLPNGVNFEHFQVANPVEPADIAHLPHPRVLYIGMLAEWFDVDLIRFSALQLPQYSFIIIGPQRTNLAILKDLPNVHVMGARPYKDIPHYMKFCDVGIMPFKKTALTDTVNPIKIFEYLAAGLPAVAPRLSELESLKSPTLLTDTPDEFVTALQEAVKRGRDVSEFIEFARSNSWRKRYDLISQHW
jgi:glycosyltransferase involved in cell wall biosynthesis